MIISENSTIMHITITLINIPIHSIAIIIISSSSSSSSRCIIIIIIMRIRS